MTQFTPPQFIPKLDAMLAMLGKLVACESPSFDKPALERVAGLIVELLADLNPQIDWDRQTNTGDNLIAHWPGAQGQSTGGILLVCHHDTVHPIGGLAANPVRIEDGFFYGPGSYDMKAAHVQVIFALRALQQAGAWPKLPITLLSTSDEEVGSAAGRPLIEAHARQASLVLVLEAVMPNWTVKTWRKGVGTFAVNVQGKAAHAGASYTNGINAIEEAAHQILRLQALTDLAAGTTVNVGVAHGGTRNNVVPDHCLLDIDVRVKDMVAGAAVEAAILGLQPVNPNAQLTVTGSVYRPPMVRTPAVVEAFGFAQRIAADMGIALREGGTGGGSDANWVSPLGVPVLDGLGPAGAASHTPNERVNIEALPAHVALLAGMLQHWQP